MTVLSMNHSVSDPWTDQVRAAAITAVRIAAEQHRAGTHALGYYLRAAIAHGLSLDEVREASGLSRVQVLELTDPAVNV